MSSFLALIFRNASFVIYWTFDIIKLVYFWTHYIKSFTSNWHNHNNSITVNNNSITEMWIRLLSTVINFWKNFNVILTKAHCTILVVETYSVVDFIKITFEIQNSQFKIVISLTFLNRNKLNDNNNWNRQNSIAPHFK